MGRRFWVSRLAGFVFLFALGFAGWSAFSRPDPDQCYACNRPVHAHSRTLALVNGRSRSFCCPACALSQHEQAGRPIKVTQLTSFLTGKALSPDKAYIVRGSNVNMCERTQQLVDRDKRPADLHYDRCAPSLIAFGQQEEAIQFARGHGGEVLTFGEIAAAFAK